MAFKPCSAALYSASLPVLMRGAHAVLSPNLGAPATPAVWQAVQTASKVFLPAPAAPAAGAAAAGGGMAAGVTAATFVGAAGAGGAAGALGSIASFASGAMRAA